MNPDTYVGTGKENTDITNPALGNLNNLGGTDGIGYFQKLLPNLMGLLLVGGTIIFLFMLLWGAVTWILSGGDKAKIESARGRITSALVGLVLMLSTFAIVKLIETFFGIDILSIDIGPLIIQ